MSTIFGHLFQYIYILWKGNIEPLIVIYCNRSEPLIPDLITKCTIETHLAIIWNGRLSFLSIFFWHFPRKFCSANIISRRLCLKQSYVILVDDDQMD
jgi:hypothetical protein